MKTETKIISCIICDIARHEEGGKTMLLGVYPKSMAMDKLPATLPNLGIWLEILPTKKKFDSIEFEMIAPDKKIVIKGKGELTISSTDHSFGLPLQLHNVTFNTTGKYIIRVALDGTMKKVAELSILKK